MADGDGNESIRFHVQRLARLTQYRDYIVVILFIALIDLKFIYKTCLVSSSIIKLNFPR